MGKPIRATDVGAVGTTDQGSRRVVATYIDPSRRDLVCGFEGGQVVRLALAELKLPPGAEVVMAIPDEFRAGFNLIRQDGTVIECAADMVLYLTDPAYRDRFKPTHPAEDLAKRVGRRAADLRRSGNLSQRDIASQLGIAAPNYARIESGRHVPSVPTLLKLADIFGVPLDQLVGR